jgi:hypothetical protein
MEEHLKQILSLQQQLKEGQPVFRDDDFAKSINSKKHILKTANHIYCPPPPRNC